MMDDDDDDHYYYNENDGDGGGDSNIGIQFSPPKPTALTHSSSILTPYPHNLYFN